MKKTLLLLLLLTTFCNAQIVTIPDAIFKAKLLSADVTTTVAKNLSGAYFKIDANNDGQIQQSEALEVSYLDLNCISCNGNATKIASLQGIQYFTNLTNLITYNNNLINYDLAFVNNSIITQLDLRDNFKSIVIQNTPNLNFLRFSDGYNPNGDVTVDNAPLLTTNFGEVFLVPLSISGNLKIKNCNSIGKLQFTINTSGVRINTISLENMASLNFISLMGASTGSNTSYPYTINGFTVKNTPLLTYLSITQTNLSSFDLCESNAYVATFVSNGNKNLNTLGLVGMPLTSFSLYNNHTNLHTICVDDNNFNLVKTVVLNNSLTASVTPYCSFTPCAPYYTVSGTNILDNNANGCDPNDLHYPNLRFRVNTGPSTGNFFANTSGDYTLTLKAGTHTITPVLENPEYFSISPTSITADFPAQGSPLLQDFCITFVPHHDVEVTVLPINNARPGFDARYKIIYKNKGNQTENGSIQFAYNDAVSDFVSASPLFDSLGLNTFTWQYTNLLPLETRAIDVVLHINSPMDTPPIVIGDQLNYLATITPLSGDEKPIDNTSSVKQIVRGSFDPNDKNCIEGPTVGTDMIDQYVHYVIRFENTGTDVATNVVVKDLIDLTKFDINTLIPLYSNHDFVTRISGNKVEFVFENINLPFDDANNDGYVAFKIKTKSNLVLGDTFSNTANIYFDYNYPIVTNTYTTTINVLGLSEHDMANSIVTYPNPVKDILQFSTHEKVLQVAVYDFAGRIISSNAVMGNQLDLSALPTGSYLLKVIAENHVYTAKIIKQ